MLSAAVAMSGDAWNEPLDAQTLKTHVDIIVLVIANLSDLYTPMINEYWKRMIDVCEESYSNMKIYLVFGEDPGKNVLINSSSMIISNTPESYIPGVLLKTIYAYGYIGKKHKYKHVLRTNLSSFLHFENTISLQRTLPSEGFCGGIFGQHDRIKFVSGAGIWTSPDVTEAIVNAESVLNYDLQDDVAIGAFLQSKIHVVFQNLCLPRYLPRIDSPYLGNEDIDYVLNTLESDIFSSKHYHVRCKHANRSRDLELLISLMNRFNIH